MLLPDLFIPCSYLGCQHGGEGLSGAADSLDRSHCIHYTPYDAATIIKLGPCKSQTPADSPVLLPHGARVPVSVILQLPFPLTVTWELTRQHLHTTKIALVGCASKQTPQQPSQLADDAP